MVTQLAKRLKILETRRGREYIYFDTMPEFTVWQESIGAAVDRFIAIILPPPPEAVDWQALGDDPPGPVFAG